MIIFSLILIVVLTAADQLIKWAITSNFDIGESLTVIPGLLEFRYIRNTGAAFGMMQNNSLFFAAVTVIMSIVIIVMLIKYKNHNFLCYSAAVMIVAGGLGNLIDRVFLNYVVDFIHVMFFDYIFNFADCLVVVGTAFFAIHVLFFMDKKKGRHFEEHHEELVSEENNDADNC